MPEHPAVTSNSPCGRLLPRKAMGRRGSVALSLSLSLAGLAMGIVALAIVLSREDEMPGKGLDSYGVDTPEGAARFPLAARAYGDVQAQMEHQESLRLLRAKRERLSEAVDSFQCGGTVEFKGKVAVLYKCVEWISHTGKSMTSYRVQWVEKKGDGRYWETKPPRFLDWDGLERTATGEVDAADAEATQARKKIDRWLAKGRKRAP